MWLTLSGSRLPTVRARDDEPELRRQVDRAIGRALVDRTYAAMLLDDPTRALGSVRCAVEHSAEVGRIRASSLHDFAFQLNALFWPTSGGRAGPLLPPLPIPRSGCEGLADSPVSP